MTNNFSVQFFASNYHGGRGARMDYQVIRLRWRRSRSKGPTQGYPICTVSVSEKKATNEIEPISVMGCPGTEEMIRASALALWASAYLGQTAQDYLLANGISLENIEKTFSQHGFTFTQIVKEEQTEVFLLTSN